MSRVLEGESCRWITIIYDFIIARVAELCQRGERRGARNCLCFGERGLRIGVVSYVYECEHARVVSGAHSSDDARAQSRPAQPHGNGLAPFVGATGWSPAPMGQNVV